MKKSLTRRKLITNSIKAGLALPFLGYSLSTCTSSTESEPMNSTTSNSPKKLSILILGGTSFLGPHQIAYALSRGHSISTFTRGKTKPTIHTDVFDKVEQLIGDRADNLTALENRSWDVVIDNSGRKVEWTDKTADLLKDKVDLYVYTSSTGVYFPYLNGNLTETTELLLEEPKGIEDESLKMEYWYGVMKTNSELAAIKHFGKDRSILVRPTYMMGPGDQTDRFIHWPVRLARGGDVLVPGKADDPVQYIDVRDVAEWMIRLAEEKAVGTYNAVGPANPQTMHEFVEAAQKAFEASSRLVKVEDYEFLKTHGVPYAIPWIMIDEMMYGSARVSNQKSKKAGLTFRNLDRSLNDIYAWWTSDALTDEQRNKFEQKPGSLLVEEAVLLNQWNQWKG